VFSGLPCIAPYCVPGGVRVVSNYNGYLEVAPTGLSAVRGCARIFCAA